MASRKIASLRPLALILSAATIAACSDSPSAPTGQPPTLPPIGSLQADLTMFDGAAAAAAARAGLSLSATSAAAWTTSAAATNSAVGANFITAAITAGIARAATIAVMAVPGATFAAATSAAPIFENGAFHWRYSVQSGGATFGADLAGRGDGAESVWEMRISTNATNPPLDDFLWYDGRALLTGQAGEWHIYDASQPSAHVEVLSIDWAHADPDSWTLAFTNVKPGSPDAGDVLTYEVDGALRLIRFFDASANTTAVIEWNHLTGTGSIHAPGYNGGVRSCWDGAQNNTTCG
jgi:hypothetical protein